MPVNSFTIAPAAASFCDPSPAIAVYFVPTARCRVHQFRKRAAAVAARIGCKEVFGIRRTVALGLMLATCAASVSQPAAGQANDTAEHVHIVGAHRIGPGRNLLLVTLGVDPGYHINANPASSDYLIPTSMTFDGPAPEHVSYPPASRLKAGFADEPLDVYEGDIVIAARFPAGALDRTNGLRFTVIAQACTNEICLPPAEIPAQAKW